jgi:hypothetical protein
MEIKFLKDSLGRERKFMALLIGIQVEKSWV